MNKSNNGKKFPGCLTIIFVILVIVMIVNSIQQKSEEKKYAAEDSYSSYEDNDYSDYNDVDLPEDLPEEEDYEDIREEVEEDHHESVPQEQPEQQSSSIKKLTKDRLIEDIYECNSILREAGLKITSIDITNREDEGDMQTIWISYEAENDECVYYGNILFVYSYDEDFWRLDVADRESEFYEAKHACDEEIALSYVRDVYEGAGADVTVMERSRTDVNEEVFDIFATWRENEVIMNTDEHIVTCRFDLLDGWRVVDVQKSRYKETWDVCGRYTLNNDKLSAVVEIHEFDIDSQRNTYTLKYSYSFTSHQSNDDLFGGPTMQQGQTYSSGPITVTDDRGYEDEYVALKADDLVRMYICGRNVNWDPIGGGYGVWVQVLSNYAETYGEFWLHR